MFGFRKWNTGFSIVFLCQPRSGWCFLDCGYPVNSHCHRPGIISWHQERGWLASDMPSTIRGKWKLSTITFVVVMQWALFKTGKHGIQNLFKCFAEIWFFVLKFLCCNVTVFNILLNTHSWRFKQRVGDAVISMFWTNRGNICSNQIFFFVTFLSAIKTKRH